MNIVLEIRSTARSYDLDSQFDLLRLKTDLTAFGFFEAEGNAKYEQYFTRTITDEELTSFVDAVRWWDYNRTPQKQHQNN